MDAPIRRIAFKEVPNKTMASQNNCKKSTLKININTPLARPSFFESNCTLTLSTEHLKESLHQHPSSLYGI